METADQINKVKPEYSSERIVIIPFVPPDCSTLLDVGCSGGAFGRALKARRKIEVWGVEPNPVAAQEAEGQLDKVINDHFAAHLPLPKAYFDVITFNDSLEHFAEPALALAFSRQLLAPGGTVICTLPNVRFIDNVAHLLFEKDWRYEDYGIRDNTHLRFFTKKSMRRLFESCGFQLLSQTGINANWWKPYSISRRLLFRFFRDFTDDMRFVQYVNVVRPFPPGHPVTEAANTVEQSSGRSLPSR